MHSAIDFNLYLITDRKGLPAGKDLLGQVEAALRGGVRCVQLREKDLAPEALLPLALELRILTRAFGASLLINGQPEIARTVEADGVHLGGEAATVTEARRILGPRRLIGVSTHHIEEITAAAREGADFVTFGPVFFTPSKAPYGEPVGLEKLRAACRKPPLPVFALGGVTAERIAQIQKAGCTRAACIGAILHADDPAAAVRRFTLQLS